MNNLTSRRFAFSECAFLCNSEFKNFNLNLDVVDDEAEQLCRRAVDEVLKNSGVKPENVDILVPVSTQVTYLHRAVTKQYSFRDDMKVINCGGMGCAAGVAGLDFARRVLSERSEPTTCLVVAHENISRGFYTGLSRGSMVTNAIFRPGACALLLSTNPEFKDVAKFKVDMSCRTYQTDDTSFWSMGYKLDETSFGGIYLPKKETLIDVSSRAVGHTIKKVANHVLPLREKVRYVARVASKKVLGKKSRICPDLFTGVDHIAMHPGGPAVIQGLSKSLGMDPIERAENSLNAYYYYGNTSSAGVFYAMAYSETMKGIKKGEKVLLMGLGAGFESNAAVLVATRNMNTVHTAWEFLLDDDSYRFKAAEAFKCFLARKSTHTLDKSKEAIAKALLEVGRRHRVSPYDDMDIGMLMNNVAESENSDESVSVSEVSIENEKSLDIHTPARQLTMDYPVQTLNC